MLQKKPFNLKQLHPSNSPLAFLLILCDELQEWNRQPFGVMDKKRSHVNDLILTIDDRGMDVEYVVRSGSIGLGFSEDKLELLKNVLSISSIFELGLRIITDIKQDDVLREIVYSEAEAPDILLRNVEKLAINIHQHYLNSMEEEYKQRDADNRLDDEFLRKYGDLCLIWLYLNIMNGVRRKYVPDGFMVR